MHILRYTDNWYNLLNDVEHGYLQMKQDIEQSLQDAESGTQKVSKNKMV